MNDSKNKKKVIMELTKMVRMGRIKKYEIKIGVR
jgi:hypothetical protein